VKRIFGKSLINVQSIVSMKIKKDLRNVVITFGVVATSLSVGNVMYSQEQTEIAYAEEVSAPERSLLDTKQDIAGYIRSLEDEGSNNTGAKTIRIGTTSAETIAIAQNVETTTVPVVVPVTQNLEPVVVQTQPTKIPVQTTPAQQNTSKISTNTLKPTTTTVAPVRTMVTRTSRVSRAS